MIEGVSLDRPPFDSATHDHQDAGQYSSKAGSHLVQEQPPEDEHPQENVEPGIGPREEPVLGAGPAQLLLDHGLEGRHDIRDVVPAQHDERHDQQCCPAGRLGFAQGLADGFHHVSPQKSNLHLPNTLPYTKPFVSDRCFISLTPEV